MTGCSGTPSPPSILTQVSDKEKKLHRRFLYRHVDFLIDTLTAEQCHRHWDQPGGCPYATPETIARRRKGGEKFPCRYDTLSTVHGSTAPGASCDCGDPLSDSGDPLDTVAAVSIARDDRTPGERYFDNEERQLIARLRNDAGHWDEINSLERDQLRDKLSKVTTRDGIGERRVERLDALLSAVADSEKCEGVTLKGVHNMPYTSFRDFLANLPGISRTDAWWLVLVAFDKPVWPADPFIDALLCSLGLIDYREYDREVERRTVLEDELTDRQISSLHRALAGHAVKGDVDQCGEECKIQKFLLSYRIRQQTNEKDGPVVVDLFSGAGGISLGFDRAECDIHWAIDNDQDATDTYRLNHPEIPHRNIVCDDIREAIDEGAIEQIKNEIGCPDIVVGGPPCQSLSQAGYRSRRASDENYSILDDERTALYEQYVQFVEQLRPKAIIMENVEGMVNEVKDTGIKVGDLVLDSLESIGQPRSGYKCKYRLLSCSELGIPQRRERVIITGIREDLLSEGDDVGELFERIEERAPSEEYDIQQGLSGLPKLRRGEGGTVVVGSARGTRSAYVSNNALDEGTDTCFNHRAREHPMEKDRTLFDEALEPGETGWEVKYKKDGEFSHLIEYDVGTEENPRFKDKYRMLRWDQPSPTIVAHLAKDANSFVLPDYHEHGKNTTGQPDNERNRGITPREAARLQSFPDEYIFLGSFTSWFRQIGNAVPPLLGEYIAHTLQEYLQERRATDIISSAPQAEKATTDD